MPRRELTPSSEPIEGQYEVILPPPKAEWSFWKDDLPNLAKIVLTPPLAGLVAWIVWKIFG